jgi:hypothetical protein
VSRVHNSTELIKTVLNKHIRIKRRKENGMMLSGSRGDRRCRAGATHAHTLCCTPSHTHTHTLYAQCMHMTRVEAVPGDGVQQGPQCTRVEPCVPVPCVPVPCVPVPCVPVPCVPVPCVPVPCVPVPCDVLWFSYSEPCRSMQTILSTCSHGRSHTYKQSGSKP